MAGPVWRGVGTPPYGPGRKHSVGAACMAARTGPRSPTHFRDGWTKCPGAPPARRRVFLPGRKYFFKSALETVLLAAILWYTDMVEDDGFRHISCGGPARLQMRKTGCLRSQNHNTAHRRRLPSGACSPRAAHPIVQVKWTRATGSRRILFSPAFFMRAASFADAAIEAAVCARTYTNSKNAPRADLYEHSGSRCPPFPRWQKRPARGLIRTAKTPRARRAP